MTLVRRLRGVRLDRVAMADAVRRVRSERVELVDLRECANQPGMGCEAEVARLMAFVSADVAMRVAAGVCGVRKDARTGELLVLLAVKDVHPAVYTHPLRMSREQQLQTPQAARLLMLAAIDAALSSGMSPALLWDGRLHRFERVPRLHSGLSRPLLEAELRDAPRWARHLASLRACRV